MQAEPASLNISQPLAKQLTLVVKDCQACGLCVRECRFLSKYGHPGEIAQMYGMRQNFSAFECSLCNLCTSVCPYGVAPARMFLEMRREATRKNDGISSTYKIIRNYEKRGISPRFSYCGLPDGCDTVFFPGCSLSGTRPETLIKLFHHLQIRTPNLGIVLDCCTKPSHDLGDESFFDTMFADLKNYLLSHDITKVIVACTSCYSTFKGYGAGLTVTTAFEELDLDFPVTAVRNGPPVTVHDPCAVRFETSIHDAVRNLIAKSGLEVQEMKHTREKTICCGEGGAVSFLQPELANNWSFTRKNEADGRPILTYCAGCANYLNLVTPTSHLLDLLFDPEAAMAGKVKVYRSPVTYLNRLKVKKYFRENLLAKSSWERAKMQDREKKAGPLKKLGLLALLVGAIVAIQATGINAYFNWVK